MKPRREALSLIQQAVLLNERRSPNRGFLSWVYLLSGNLDPDALIQAVDDVAEASEMLRIEFGGQQDNLPKYQSIITFSSGTLKSLDLRVMDKEASVANVVAEVENRYCKLSGRRYPRLHGRLSRLKDRQYFLEMFVSEVAADAESGIWIAEDISRRYREYVQGDDVSDRPIIGTSYLDYIGEMYPTSEAFEEADNYWERLIETAQGIGNWPTDSRGEAVRIEFRILPPEWERLIEVARNNSLSPYALVLSYYVETVRDMIFSNVIDVIMAVPQRYGAKTDHMIGSFHSTGRLRIKIKSEDSRQDIFGQVCSSLEEVIRHSLVPYTFTESRNFGNKYDGCTSAIHFYMFEERRGLDLVGVRQRRYRFDKCMEALRLNCVMTRDGGCSFVLSSVTAPMDRVQSLAIELERRLQLQG